MTVERQLAQALQRIADLQKEVDRLGADVVQKDELLSQKDNKIQSQDKQIQTKDNRIMSLEAQLSYLLKKVFGKMSEKKHLPVDPCPSTASSTSTRRARRR